MTSLPRTARIIVFTSCRAAAYGIARPALRSHDGILHLDARMCKAAPAHSLSIARIAWAGSTQRDLD
jgi:hypothetical protein